MSTRKQKKPKQKTVSLQEFTASLEPTLPSAGQNVIYAPKKPMMTSTSWADEVEDELITEKERIVLPSAPRSARGPAYDDGQIPRIPPYKAHLGNISYDIEDEDVFRFFGGLEIDELRLPRDTNNRLRGFGYVEFRNREDLIEALIMNEQVLRGRPIRISLGVNHGDSGDGGRGGRKVPVDETPADWRAGGGGLSMNTVPDFGRGQPFYPQRSDFPSGRREYNTNKSDFYNRRPDYGGRPHFDNGRSFDRHYNSESYGNEYYGGRDNGHQRIRIAPRPDFDYQRRPPGRDYAYSDGNYHGGNDRGDYYRQQFRHHDEPMHGNGRSSLPRSTSAYSYRDSTSSLFSNDSHGSGSVGTKESHREGSRGEKLDPEQGPMKSPTSPASPPRERKKLVLQPRSKSVAESETPVSNSAIFGGARPVDTAAREREIEKKLSEMNLLEAKKLRILQRPKTEVAPPPMDFVYKKHDTSQRFRRDSQNSNSSSRPNPPPLMAEPSSPPRLFTQPLPLRRRRSDEIERDKDTNSEPEDDRDLRFIEFHRLERKGRQDVGSGREPPMATEWRGNRGGSNRGRGGAPRIN